MTTGLIKPQGQGLKFARLLMVLSSISPLFVIWAVKGSSLIPDPYFIGLCALMIIVPNAILWLRIRIVKKQSDKRELTVGSADDHRNDILVYLFAMMLPFYSADLATWRDLGATVAALLFIVFLFWHLNLHYMNLIFAALELRVFTVYPPVEGNVLTGKTPYVVITRRVRHLPGETLIAYRLSDTVYLEG